MKKTLLVMAAALLAMNVQAARDTETLYNQSCIACHASGAAGAPKTGDAAAWAPRMEKGIDVVVKNAINGINAMPPKGMCMDCTEEEFKALVEFMVKAK